MYVRLAFAVAAHLEPEILVVDEVLAVGDAEFQKKCLARLGEVSRGGRTVLFVSHALSAILNLCTKALFLQRGAVIQIGEPGEVCAAYGNLQTSSRNLEGRTNILRDISLMNAENNLTTVHVEGSHLKFRLVVASPENKCMVSLVLRDVHNAVLLELFDRQFTVSLNGNATTVVEVDAGRLPLLPGSYFVDFWFGNRMAHRIERIDSVFEFAVVAGIARDLPLAGVFYFPSKWRTGDTL